MVMNICVMDFSPPRRVALNAIDDEGRIIIEVEPFSADFTFHQGTYDGDVESVCKLTDFEVWMWIRQNGNEKKIGEMNLDSDWYIEDWDGSPIDRSLRTDDDSSRILVSDWTEPNPEFEPGPAELFITPRYGDDARHAEGEYASADIELVANFPTEDDIAVTNVSLGSPPDGEWTPSDDNVPISVGVENPLPRDATVVVEVTASVNGTQYHRHEFEETATGTLSFGESELSTFETTIPVSDEPGDVEVCATVR